MSNDTNNGGPAFPGQWYDFQPSQMSGPDIVAHVAYMMADAMLKAREASQEVAE